MRKMIFLVLFALDVALLSSLSKVDDALRIDMLNVGQGDAVLLTTEEGNHILVDGGPGNGVLMELAEVMPWLFSDIDVLVMTHPHADHIEGLIPVLDRFDLGLVLMTAPVYDSLIYSTFLERLENKKIVIAKDDISLLLGSTRVDILYPFSYQAEFENVNNASPVLVVEGGDGERILLSGDAELQVEKQIVDRDLGVDVDIMKAGHHGSRTSNSLEFLEAFSPEFLLISAGEENSYGHPHEETLEKAAELGITVYRTDLDGRISLRYDQSWHRDCGVFLRVFRSRDQCN